jgi:tetratricopeptide (TPR) repeat protein
MYTLISYATQWGSKYGGINSFNTDFLTAFGFAYHQSVQIVCVVANATAEEKEQAAKVHVRLVPLPYTPEATSFGAPHGQAGLTELQRLNIDFDPDKTVWLGHDRITGEAAIASAQNGGGRSAVIHHMSYDHYESYAEDSQSAERKTLEQTTLFQKADLVLAVGPLLGDSVSDRLGGAKSVHMLIPGLAEIDAQEAPNTFVAFMSGRLSDDAARIKQGHLGIAAFARAQREAREDNMPDALLKHPKLLLRGVDFEGQLASALQHEQRDPETELKQFAESYADAVTNLHTLPYTYDRRRLYSELRGASVALMPSWHEGFGLVAWEAIAAGVPLIISKNSGVYRLLEEKYPGAEIGYVYPLDIRGAGQPPFFREEDLTATVAALKAVAKDPRQARKKASRLRNMLLEENTWAACSEQASTAFGWELRKGSLPDITPERLPQTQGEIVTAPVITDDKDAPLQMPAKQWRAGAGMADSQLLRAEEALLPFDPARQPDVDSLNAWLDDQRWQQAVRLITGAGGQGKTRLALELCQHRLRSDWYAGFLDSDLEANRMTATWQALRKLNKPLLIVVDYAETRQTAFLALLKASLQNPLDKPVRMLLLARDAGEWWDNLPSRDRQCEALLSGHATSGPFRLPALYAAEPDRREAYSKALRAFAGTLGANAPDIVPNLIGEHFERPLYIQMAALLALYGEQPITAQGLTKALLNHERRYWQGILAQFNWPEPERRAEQLLALTTLAGGFTTPRAAQPYWDTAKGIVLTPADFSSLFRALVTLYPGTQGLQALRPDLLGEALVAQALLRPGGETLLDAVLTNTASQPVRRNALTVLARLSIHRLDLEETLVEGLSRHFRHCYMDIVAVSTETTSLLPKLAEMAFVRLSSVDKSQVSGLLAPLFTEESVQLAELSCQVSEYLVEKARAKFEKKPGSLDHMADYAQKLSNYAVHLGRRGHYQQACEVSMSGLELFNRLAMKAPDRFRPGYATSMSNHANNLSELGRYEEALEHARESLEINRRLVQMKPDRFEPDYAASLNNYANQLRELGRYEEALEHAREVLEIRRRLVQMKPDRFEPDYAMSLNNYANNLSELGRYEEALEHAQEALEIRRRLVQKNPDRFEPDYAMSLNNYANHLTDAGRYEEALEHAQEALEIRRRLVQMKPDRFEPDYAVSLSSYANRLTDTGRYEEALEHAQEALEIRRRLVQKNPDRFEPSYATSLSNYANHLTDAGRYEEALEHAREVLEIRRRLVQMKPDRFEPDYAMSLNNYANHLTDAGRYEEALEHAQEALEIRRRLVQKNPDRFEPDYAMSLNNYASHLTDAGRYEEALEHAQEALEIRRRLVQKNPKRIAEVLFLTACFEHFLAWLSNQNNESDQPDPDQDMTFIQSHQRPLMHLFAAFVKACWAIDRDARSDSFRRVLSSWDELSIASKSTSKPYWLCAAAWCAKFEPADLVNMDWIDRWRQFAQQRNNHISQWMMDVARRLGFEWPG